MTLRCRSTSLSAGISQAAEGVWLEFAEIDSRPQPSVLLIPDFESKFPVYYRVLSAYFSASRYDLDLVIYIPQEYVNEKNLAAVTQILEENSDAEYNVMIQAGEIEDERQVFAMCDYYIATRSLQTVKRSGYADMFGLRILSGVDAPIFREPEWKHKPEVSYL